MEHILSLTSEAIDNYKNLACKHLSENNTVLDVAAAGVNENGMEIYGIKMLCDDGTEEWYDPGSDDPNMVMGWSDKETAHEILQSQVLPNIGYSVHQRIFMSFHKMMS